MSFTKINYHSGEEIFEVKIKDTTGALIENWVFMKRDFNKWVDIIRRKLGIRLTDKKVERDLDWAM